MIRKTGFAMIVIIALFTACAPDARDVNRDGVVSEYLVTFEVLGTSDHIDIVYNTEIAEAESVTDATVPWTVSTTMLEGSFVKLSARNQTDAGQVSARVLVDGEIMASDTEIESFGQAAVSGQLGDPESF